MVAGLFSGAEHACFHQDRVRERANICGAFTSIADVANLTTKLSTLKEVFLHLTSVSQITMFHLKMGMPRYWKL